MSTEREWVFIENPASTPHLASALDVHPLVARLLAQRGLTDPGVARAFLNPAFYGPCDPAEMAGAAKAVAILREAIARGDRIRVWGDRDADGVTATVVLVEALQAAGASVDYGLPRRYEGHGLSERAVQEAADAHVDILLTCDTGISDHAAIQAAHDRGMRVIVSDHHDLPHALPPADAIVTPRFLPGNHPFYGLTGVGVAYVLARLLLQGESITARVDRLLDVTAIGLVADVAAPVADARYLIQRGTEALAQTQRVGLAALARLAEIDLAHVSAEDIAHKIAPRINAAGRIGDPDLAARLLFADDLEQAETLAGRLEALNQDRRARTDALMRQVDEILAREPDRLRERAIVVEGQQWETGVLGVVAGRVAAKHGRPAILVSRVKGGRCVASARSIEGIDIHRAILTQRESLLSQGGHPMAAGFTVCAEDLAGVVHGILQALRDQPVTPVIPPLVIDAIVPWAELGLDLARAIAELSPFGASNEMPTFVAQGGRTVRSQRLGPEGSRHYRLMTHAPDGKQVAFTWFDAQTLPEPGAAIDIAFRLQPSFWHGRERLDLQVVGWRPIRVREVRPSSAVVSGREIVDWRQEALAAECVRRLQARYGDELLVWAEPPDDTDLATVGRGQAEGHTCTALAILTPPPDSAAIRSMLTATDPSIVYLLPPQAVAPLDEQTALRKILGMLRVALRRDDGEVDWQRMAAVLACRTSTVQASVEVLRALGRIRLSDGQDGTAHASLPDGNAAPAPEAWRRARRVLRASLAETEAYRAAYPNLAPETILSLSREE